MVPVEEAKTSPLIFNWVRELVTASPPSETDPTIVVIAVRPSLFIKLAGEDDVM
jgi:hypothetical protein